MRRKNIAIIATIATLFLVSASFGGIVFGTEFGGDISGDFVCENEGPFTDLISNFLTLFVFGGPVAGAIIWFLDRASDSITSDGFGFWIFDNGKNAAIAGVVAPFGLYAFQFILSVAFGIDISCLTP